MNIREKVFAADDIGTELVPVPEWGVEVQVRGLTLGQRNDALTESRGEDGVLNLSQYYALIIIATVLDPADGTHVFLDDDVENLLAKSSNPADNLAKKALALSGLTEQDDVQAGVDAAGEGYSEMESDVPAS